MKKIIGSFAVILLATALLVGCAGKDENVLTVGATPEPHAEMLKLVVDDLAEQGITLKIMEFTDYVTPNEALESGQIDANFFQHLPYMDSFNKERNYNLVSAGGIHIEPMALYSKKVDSLDQLQGGKVAIPNDPTNEGRALLLLQSAGLIELNPAAGIEATPLNITANPRKFEFTELEAATMPRILSDVDAAVINGNYAIPAGLIASVDGLYVEGADSPYVNIIAVKDGNQNNPAIVALVKALQSHEIKDFIAQRYPNGEVVPVF